MKYIIAPSILSANFAKLGEDAKNAIAAGADWLHFDVMDNHYVPNLTMGPMVLKSLKDYGINVPIDVHLMVEPVDDLIVKFAKAGADYISFHPEASKHVDRSIDLIKQQGVKAGLVLNPATNVSCLEYLLDKLDLILLMTVNPGFAGQQFIPTVLPKIEQVAKMIKKSGKDIRLEVDGGINAATLKDVAKSGADTFVAGSYIFNSSDYKATINTMRSVLSDI